MEPREERKGKRPLEARDMSMRRQRKSISQIKNLEDAYIENRYPSREVKEKLAESTGLDYRQVEHWFADQRYKSRRKKYKKNSNDVLERNKMLMASKLDPSAALGFISSSYLTLDVGLSSTITTLKHKSLESTQIGQPQCLRASKLSFLQKSFAPRPMTLRQQHMIPSHNFETLSASTRQQMKQTYGCTIYDRHIAAATRFLNSKNGFMISSSNGPILEVESADMCHPNGGPRAILEYQFFPECTSICSSSKSIQRGGATGNLQAWNLPRGPSTIQEYHRFFPEKPSIHSEENVRADKNH